MPQENDQYSITFNEVVSEIDYSEARNILDLTSNKQKQLRRQRSPPLKTQLLLKRTYTHVCQLLDSECSITKQALPLAPIDTNKRKLSNDDNDQEMSSANKKSKGLVDKDILQFLRELNAVKVMNSAIIQIFAPNRPLVCVV